MDVVDRIRNEIEDRDIKQKDLVDFLDVNQGTFAKWISIKEENRRDIPNTVLANIAKYLDVDVEYLLGMQEEKKRTSAALETNYVEIPTIYAGAGAEAFAVNDAEKRMYPIELIPPQIALDENVLISVIVGNSMEPLYYENDIVFIDMVNGRDFIPVNGTYLVRYGETVQVKDVEFLGNGQILLFSRNSPAIINPTELGLEWEIVGKPYANLHPNVGSKLKLKR